MNLPIAATIGVITTLVITWWIIQRDHLPKGPEPQPRGTVRISRKVRSRPQVES